MANLFELDLAAFPSVAALGKRCFELPAFAQAHPNQQAGYKSGKGNH
jgi:maleylpyruvate isomerase